MDEAVEEGVQRVEERRLHLAHKLAGKVLQVLVSRISFPLPELENEQLAGSCRPLLPPVAVLLIKALARSSVPPATR